MILDRFDLKVWSVASLVTLTLSCAPSASQAKPEAAGQPQGTSQGELAIGDDISEADISEADVSEEGREPESSSEKDEPAPWSLQDAARAAEEAWIRESARNAPRGAPGTPAPPMRAPSSGSTAVNGPALAGSWTSGSWSSGGRTISAQPLNSQLGGPMGPPVGTPGLWLLTLKDTLTGWVEDFLLQVALPPGISRQSDRPLLVAFHRYGNSMYDIPGNTGYPGVAFEHGWFLLAPLGAFRINVASRESQINTRLAIEFVLNHYSVDQERLYAVGHSMGGGNMLNYAARHTDLSGPTFAAVVNHTGTLSQNHSYIHDCAPGGGVCVTDNPWEFWYGGTPAMVPFEYLLASVIDLPYVNGLLGPPPPADPATSLAANLVHLPILSFWADGDPLVELIAQNEAFAAHMGVLGATKHEVQIVSAMDHDWNTLDPEAACKWLSQFTRSEPQSGASLGFEDGRLFYFEIEQDQADAFSPFDWQIDSALGLVSIENTENLEKITVDLAVAGIDPSMTGMEARLRPGDGTLDQIVFENVSSGPTSVLRDNSPLNAPWAYDSAMQRLTLWENDGSVTHSWAITF